MFNIAILDDEKEYIDILSNLVSSYKFKNSDCQLQINSYTSPDDLLKDIDEGEVFDIIFLDCVMEEMSGIKVAKQIRTKKINSIIIFVTSSIDYAYQSYSIRAYQYLLKPIEKLQLHSILDEVTQLIETKRNKSILVNTQQGLVRIPISEILYVELYGKKLIYHLNDISISSISIRKSFKNEISELLNDSKFQILGSSFVVNMSKVKKVHLNSCTIVNDDVLTIPRNQTKQFKDSFIAYWLGDNYD